MPRGACFLTIGTMLLRIGCPMRVQPRACQTSMPYFRNRPTVFWSFLFLIFLSGCEAKPECDSTETMRNKHTSGSFGPPGHHTSEAENSKNQPSYVLGEKIVTTSTSEDKRTLKCSGSISTTVGDTKASKEVNFTVQQSDGKITVSVDPFQF
jgi:hypothetical protein